jgi:Zn-dependent protease
MQQFDIAWFVMVITTLILGVTVHEWAHAITADRLGDDTPRRQGRVTLWPPAHLDPLGTILMIVSTVLGMGIGWGKPVQTDPRKYTINQRLGDSLVSFAGPLSNLVIATVFALLLRANVLPPNDPFTAWSKIIVLINSILFLFNLIPIFPLDGSHLLANALPPDLAAGYRRFGMQFGWILFLLLIMWPSFRQALSLASGIIYTFLVGAGA